MSPEVLQGKGYDWKSDVWSLGCVMHILVAGFPPFWDNDKINQRNLVCSQPLNLNTDRDLNRLNFQAKSLLTAMLEKNPLMRPTIDEVLAHPWLQEWQSFIKFIRAVVCNDIG